MFSTQSPAVGPACETCANSECGYENGFGYRGRRLGDTPAAALAVLQGED